MQKPDSGTECGTHIWGTLVSKTFSALPAEGRHLCHGQAHPQGRRLPGRSAGQKKGGGLGEEGCCCGLSPSKCLSAELVASKQQPLRAQRSRESGAVLPATAPSGGQGRRGRGRERTGVGAARARGTSLLGDEPAGAFPGDRCPTEEGSPGLTAGSWVTLGKLINLSEYPLL